MNPSIRPTGHCFDDALDFIEERVRAAGYQKRFAETCGLLLVHGICRVPEDQPEDAPERAGERFAHAWVEEREGDLVWQSGVLFNPGHEHHLATIVYSVDRLEFYRELRVEAFTHYTLREAWEENKRTAHYGPWRPEYAALCRTRRTG